MHSWHKIKTPFRLLRTLWPVTTALAMALLVTCAVALRASQEIVFATDGGVVTVQVYKVNQSGNIIGTITGAKGTFTSQSGAACTQSLTFTTNSQGKASLGNCTGNGIFVLTSMSATGYRMADNLHLQIGDTAPGTYGQSITWPVHMTEKDSDGDGVMDLSDNCPSQSGPASNGGCPIPAPAPTTSSPKTTTKPKTTPKQTPAVVNQNNAGDKTPPTKPESLAAKFENGKVLLTWGAASDDLGVTGYSVERSVDGLDWEYLAQNIQETSYTDEDLVADTYYFYRIRAQDAAGNQSEALFSEAVLAAADNTSDNEKDANATKSTADQQKSSKGIVFGVVGGIAVLAVGAGLWLRRRRNVRLDTYDYVTPQNLSPSPPASQPSQPPVAHTSISLKDMVMQDYHPDDPKNKPKSPPS